jgi:uncharacterized membrane protein
MNAGLRFALVAVASAIVMHLVAVGAAPRLIMGEAMRRIAETAGGWNRIYHAAQVTPQTQEIVRSSPDLAYSTCAIDLSEGPVRIVVNPSPGYWSAAVYGADTDVVLVRDDRDAGGRPLRLLVVGDRTPLIARPEEQVVRAPGDKALLLVRRLAPSAQAFANADAARKADSCAFVPITAG